MGIDVIQAAILSFLGREIEPYSGRFESAPQTGLARKTGYMPDRAFHEALSGLVEQGLVVEIPTTGLTGLSWYHLDEIRQGGR